MSTNKISFNNFKAFGEKIQTFSKKPITLIYGPNSIGKSSFIHMMAYKYQLLTKEITFSPEIITLGDEISLNGFDSFVHNKNPKNKILLTLDTSNNDTWIEVQVGKIFTKNKLDTIKDLHIKYFYQNELFVESVYHKNNKYKIKINLKHEYINSLLESIRKKGTWSKMDFYSIFKNKDSHKFEIETNILFKLLFTHEYGDDKSLKIREGIRRWIKKPVIWTKEDELESLTLEELEKKHIEIMVQQELNPSNFFVSQEKKYERIRELIKDKSAVPNVHLFLEIYVQSILASINQLVHYQNAKMDFHYIGPLRFYPEKGNKLKHANPKYVNSENFWFFLEFYSEIQNPLNKWLSDEKLKTPYEIVIHKQYDLDNLFKQNLKKYTKSDIAQYASYTTEVLFRDKRSNTLVHNREIGLGITQILPVLGMSMIAENTLFAIEQPELHLHPRIQSEIADEFIKSYKEKSNEFLIETHSEYLLLRIMKRMRETAEGKIEKNDVLALTPDDVCIVYVDNDEDSTYIRELRLSPRGKLLDHWPNGFFEEGFKERFS